MEDTSNGTFNRCTFIGNLFSCPGYLLPNGCDPQIGCSKTQYKTRSLFKPRYRTLINKGGKFDRCQRKNRRCSGCSFYFPVVLPPALDGTYMLSDMMPFSGPECSLTSIPGIGIKLINPLPIFVLKVASSSSGDCRVLPPSSLLFLATMVSCSKRKCSCKTLKAY